MIDLQRRVGEGYGFLHRTALDLRRAGQIDDGVTRLLGRKLIVALRALDLPLQLGDVSQVIQRERIAGIIQICFVEQLLCLGEFVLPDGFYPFAVQALNRGQLASTRDIDL